MTLTNSNYWLKRAQKERYAIGAFNANTMEQVQAVVSAAAEEAAPVIIQISHRALNYVGTGSVLQGLRYMAEVGKTAAASVQVPVILHLDHANEIDVLQAISLGFSSVMFDGGDLPFEENIKVTRRVCELAHEAGLTMEAEIGEVGRLNGESVMIENELTNPDQAAEFVEKTGVDALAVALGSMHAVKSKEIDLDLERLEKIARIVKTPLVLHGSSGVKDESVLRGIQLGICKVNVATQLNQSFTKAVRGYLDNHPAEVDPRRYLEIARDSMKQEVIERMRLVGISKKALLAEYGYQRL